MKWGVGLLVAGLIGVLVGPVSAATVHTDDGSIAGVSEAGLTVYKGVPFATPPVGKLRWRMPHRVRAWAGVLKANTFKPSCIQGPGFRSADGPQSEDCLYLNIWSPAKSSGAKLPVMVWIHGCGFTGGSPSTPVFWGDELAKKGVIVVNIAYRLGALGFLAHPGLSAESPTHSSGNYALGDMIAGLEWVKENIAAFGGDPARVTIFGESVGSISAHLLTVAPSAKGLFASAIGQSGAAMVPVGGAGGLETLANAEKAGEIFAKSLGASSVAELRALPAAKLIAGNPSVGWPIIDGNVIPEDPYKVFQAGKQTDVPILIGTNAHEGRLFTIGLTDGKDAFVKFVKDQYGALAGDILKLYPANTDSEARDSRSEFLGDTLFGWNTWTWARLQHRTGKGKVFYYHFEHAPPAVPNSPFPNLGATHLAEAPYVFGHPGNAPWTAYDRELSNAMSTYWTNFAKTGDPNGGGVPNWPSYSERSEWVQHFGDKIDVGGVAYENRFRLLDKTFLKPEKPPANR